MRSVGEVEAQCAGDTSTGGCGDTRDNLYYGFVVLPWADPVCSKSQVGHLFCLEFPKWGVKSRHVFPIPFLSPL